MSKFSNVPRRNWIAFAVWTTLYLLFLLWVESWWGLLLVPFIFDLYITRRIKWTWWKTHESPAVRYVMSWVDAIVFAMVAIYFINQFFFQNFVIPSSSLEKTLLTGDYLLVSKLSYGPRIPQTPLTAPLTQHNLPLWLGGGKSYLEWPSWDYRRVKGFGTVQVGDIVVFNYPSGDTLATNYPNQDFYSMVYTTGSQVLNIAEPKAMDSLTALQQRAVYNKLYAVGRQTLAHEPSVGEIISRPTDRRENYVKRCVAVAGQTLQIKNNVIYLDGKAQAEPENVQYLYNVEFKQTPTADFLKENGITNEDLSRPDEGIFTMPLTQALRQKLAANKNFSQVVSQAPSYGSWLFPLNMAKDWTTGDYGPVWVPKRGESIALTLDNLPLYERCIKVYEKNDLKVTPQGEIFINGKKATNYTFKMDYYWMMGDNRDLSADSRFWGFVPEDHIVGRPLFVWLSLNPDYSLFDGKIRWDRFFKWVGDIK